MFFLKILATACRIDEVRKPFSLNLNCGSAAGFMTSSEKSFWVVDGMTFWPWKK